MGKLILEQAVQALRDGGIPAARAMPAEKAPDISEPVAAVSLQAMDLRSKKVTVLVTVLTPAALGAAACEEAALSAGQILAELGGKCSMEACRFDGRTGLFMMEITAQFNSEVPKVTINGVELGHVLAFTSWRTLDETVTDWDNTKWNFRLEEYFPMGDDVEADPAGKFTLMHICENGSESYIDSTWTYQRKVWDASGVRQIRLGVANSMDVG